jgi:hypothetical protein
MVQAADLMTCRRVVCVSASLLVTPPQVLRLSPQVMW